MRFGYGNILLTDGALRGLIRNGCLPVPLFLSRLADGLVCGVRADTWAFQLVLTGIKGPSLRGRAPASLCSRAFLLAVVSRANRGWLSMRESAGLIGVSGG